MIIADTGFWLALANTKDKFHTLAKTTVEKIDKPLITTWPVMTETCHLLLSRLGPHAQETFIKSYANKAFTVFDLGFKDAPRLENLMKKYINLPMDLADASLVVLAEHLGSGEILSTDERDFQTYRWKNRHPFKNLLLSD